jgi:predicted nucleotidyltransferase
MKKFLVIVLSLYSLSGFALNENLSNADLVKLSGSIDYQLSSLRDELSDVLSAKASIVNDDEGQIVATIRLDIEADLDYVKAKLFYSDNMTEEDLRTIDYKELQKRLDRAEENLDLMKE